MQKSSVTSFANGALKQGLYEGAYVDQRVELRDLGAGANVLVFTYQVRDKHAWAYDYVDQYRVVGGTLTGTPVVAVGALDASGNQTNTVTVTFDVATAGAATIFFSAHIASQLDHPGATAAGSISGAPYHVSLVSLNCASVGSRDNQVMASAIQGASVTIVKQASPADGTPFPFHIVLGGAAALGTSSSFTLAVGSATVPDSVTYQKVAPGAVSISEDALPSGWHLDGVSCSGASVTLSGQSVSFEVMDQQTVTCTFTNGHTAVSAGSLVITKEFDPKASGYAGTFSLSYTCSDGTHNGTVTLAAGGSSTITGIPAGTSCAVTEPTLPAAPEGWTFGTPSISAAAVTIVANATAAVTVTNSITQDTGSLVIHESTSNPDHAVLPAAFTGTYDCGPGYLGAWSLPDGGSLTISGIPSGSSCSVHQDALSSVTGFSWATPEFSASSVVTVHTAPVEVTVENSLRRDRGSFSFTKVLVNPDRAKVQSTFPLTWTCGLDTDGTALTGTVDLAAGATHTVDGIPTGNVCSVSEGALTPVETWTWQTPRVSPPVTVDTDEATSDLVTVTNSIVRQPMNLSLTMSVTSSGPYYGGSNVTYTLLPHNAGPAGALPGWSVTALLPAGSELVGLSGEGYTCYTTLVCRASAGLAAGEDGSPITMVVRIPVDVTGEFKAVSYVSPAVQDRPESNPLVLPTLTTDTAATASDNDAQAVVDVLAPQPEGIVLELPGTPIPTLAHTGTTVPLASLLGALGIVALGLILIGAARVDRKPRKS